MMFIDPKVIEALRVANRVVVFTGAGVSAESGIPTFRDKQTGLWENFDAAELATLDAFERDPALNGAEDWYLSQSRTPATARLRPWPTTCRTSPSSRKMSMICMSEPEVATCSICTAN